MILLSNLNDSRPAGSLPPLEGFAGPLPCGAGAARVSCAHGADMAKRKPVRVEFESRRRKEQLAFLVVKFLKSFIFFRTIREQFESASCRADLSECRLFEKVRELEESLAFDLKEIAHSLFRGQRALGGAEESARE